MAGALKEPPPRTFSRNRHVSFPSFHTHVFTPLPSAPIRSSPQAYTAGVEYTLQSGVAWGFTPYSNAIQGYNGITSLGTYTGWTWVPDAACPSGLRLGFQSTAGGVSCGTVNRNARINYACSANGLTQLTSVSEPTSCSYLFTFEVACARNTYMPGTLCEC